jgi:imidazolonepropionase-like amidohydrolase
VHLVPTVINIANFPSFADGAEKYPTYARHMRELHLRNPAMVRAAVEAGINVHAGTDAGGFVEHGRIADEVAAMGELIGARAAIHAASHNARGWLGLPSYDIGAAADLVIYDEDPTADLAILRHPAVVVRSGRVSRSSG